jgi:hypothetical protein
MAYKFYLVIIAGDGSIEETTYATEAEAVQYARDIIEQAVEHDYDRWAIVYGVGEDTVTEIDSYTTDDPDRFEDEEGEDDA